MSIFSTCHLGMLNFGGLLWSDIESVPPLLPSLLHQWNCIDFVIPELYREEREKNHSPGVKFQFRCRLVYSHLPT